MYGTRHVALLCCHQLLPALLLLLRLPVDLVGATCIFIQSLVGFFFSGGLSNGGIALYGIYDLSSPALCRRCGAQFRCGELHSTTHISDVMGIWHVAVEVAGLPNHTQQFLSVGMKWQLAVFPTNLSARARRVACYTAYISLSIPSVPCASQLSCKPVQSAICCKRAFLNSNF